MRITLDWLNEQSACFEGKEWFKNQSETDGIKLVKKLTVNHVDWSNWLIVRLMNRRQKVQYAVFAAEQTIEIYDKKYPNDDRPRKAIEAAKEWIKNPSANAVADAAHSAANAAAYAAYSAANAAYAATYAAYAAAYAVGAADAAAYAVNAADAAYAADAANAAAYAADAAEKKSIKKKIIFNGIKILARKA